MTAVMVTGRISIARDRKPLEVKERARTAARQYKTIAALVVMDHRQSLRTGADVAGHGLLKCIDRRC
jgi:hypothetical protein